MVTVKVHLQPGSIHSPLGWVILGFIKNKYEKDIVW